MKFFSPYNAHSLQSNSPWSSMTTSWMVTGPWSKAVFLATSCSVAVAKYRVLRASYQ